MNFPNSNIIDPVSSLPEELIGSNTEAKKKYLIMVFNLKKIDTREEDLWYWFLYQENGIAIFSLSHNCLVKLPYKVHYPILRESEYFWNISWATRIPFKESDESLCISMGWFKEPNNVQNIEHLWVLEWSELKIMHGLPNYVDMWSAIVLITMRWNVWLIMDTPRQGWSWAMSPLH